MTRTRLAWPVVVTVPEADATQGATVAWPVVTAVPEADEARVSRAEADPEVWARPDAEALRAVSENSG